MRVIAGIIVESFIIGTILVLAGAFLLWPFLLLSLLIWGAS
jgi:hypothetical protein